MGLHLKIEDKKTLERIERLRRGMSPQEFLSKCLSFALTHAEAEIQKLPKMPAPAEKQPLKKNGDAPAFAKARAKFRGLEAPVILAALEEKSRKNPVYAEVTRLVNNYAGILEAHFRKNRGSSGTLNTELSLPIEKISCRIAVEALTKKMKPARPVTVH